MGTSLFADGGGGVFMSCAAGERGLIGISIGCLTI